MTLKTFFADKRMQTKCPSKGTLTRWGRPTDWETALGTRTAVEEEEKPFIFECGYQLEGDHRIP